MMVTICRQTAANRPSCQVPWGKSNDSRCQGRRGPKAPGVNAAVLTALLAAAAATAGPVAAETYDVAVLRALDKVTARISTLAAPVDERVTFGSLHIVARVCDKRPPEEPPESAVFLDIAESRPNEVPIPVFHGWMFASSPAVSAMDHPVYDIWVLDCRSSDSTAEAMSTDSDTQNSAGN